MNSPICDFVKKYAEENALRLHMPGHKGMGALGCEALDITEIDGADSLYEAVGIIAESEKNAGLLFGATTYYSTEGSSLSIRAMLTLALWYAKDTGRAPLILAGRNAHRTFIGAAALIDLDVTWLTGKNYLCCTPSPDEVAAALDASEVLPTAVYLTSPDYLGNTADIRGISDVCRKRGVLLLVDNAHGAYLKFLPHSRHPIDLGADACVDSAHKTLPALTGAAYLHISGNAPSGFGDKARVALSMFGSTSPSYLILQSLDALNPYLSDTYKTRLSSFLPLVESLKKRLTEIGYTLVGDEPLKLTLLSGDYGYDGYEIAEILSSCGIICEFSDRDFTVMMLSAEQDGQALESIFTALSGIERRKAKVNGAPPVHTPTRVMSARDAALSPCERVSVRSALGKILASPTVGCPPAVPIIMCGELIDEKTVAALEYYGTESCLVVKDSPDMPTAFDL